MCKSQVVMVLGHGWAEGNACVPPSFSYIRNISSPFLLYFQTPPLVGTHSSLDHPYTTDGLCIYLYIYADGLFKNNIILCSM